MSQAGSEREEDEIDAVEDLVDLRDAAESRLTQVPRAAPRTEGSARSQRVRSPRSRPTASSRSAPPSRRSAPGSTPSHRLTWARSPCSWRGLNASIVSQNRRTRLHGARRSARTVRRVIGQQVADQLAAHAEATTGRTSGSRATSTRGCWRPRPRCGRSSPSSRAHPTRTADLHRIAADLQTALDTDLHRARGHAQGGRAARRLSLAPRPRRGPSGDLPRRARGTRRSSSSASSARWPRSTSASAPWALVAERAATFAERRPLQGVGDPGGHRRQEARQEAASPSRTRRA